MVQLLAVSFSNNYSIDHCMAILVLLRHGQSQWNLENRFTGWSDVPLTPRGEQDAARVAGVLQDIHFDRAFTSDLQRAQRTLQTILTTLRVTIPVTTTAALNERHYGDLQGLNKAETALKYGKKQVQLWRRSYSVRPPNGESIEDCEKRVLPFFDTYVLPELRAGKNVLLVAHGNSLRPLMKHFDGLTGDASAVLEIDLCTPYVYTFDENHVIEREVREVPGIITTGASLII